MAVTVAALLVAAGAIAVSLQERSDPVSAYEELPVQAIETYEIFSDTVEDLTRRADIVFVGDVVGYEEGVFVSAPEPEDPTRTSTVFDGIVFEPVEVLKGSVPDRAVIAIPGRLQDEHGQPTSRIEQPVARYLQPAVAASKQGMPAGRYAVFASPMRGAADLFVFYGSGGVVQLTSGGRLAPAVAPPFVDLPDRPAAALERPWPEIRSAIIAEASQP